MTDLTSPIFHDEDKARQFFEAQRWPNGPICPFCGSSGSVSRLKGKSMGSGWYYCNACDQRKFTVRTGSVMERSHIPLAKWALGFRIMAASKKGVSSKQLQRMLGLASYKSAWFMAHRIREAMRDAGPGGAGPIGGDERIIESDETYIGGTALNAKKGKGIPKKYPVLALVERHGEVRVRHVPRVTGKNVRRFLLSQASRDSFFVSDDAAVYENLAKLFYASAKVVHSKRQYTDEAGFAHTNTVEAFFAILKRGIIGSFHGVSEKHLQKYAEEFAFRWNTRSKLGIEDEARTNFAIKGAAGKRLTYRRPDATH